MLVLKKIFSTNKNRQPLYLQNIIKPLYIAASVLGLLPYSVTFVESKHSFTIMRKSIYVNSLCGVTICFTIFVFTGLHVKEVLLTPNENINLTEAIMTQMNYVLEIIALVIFCVVAYVCAFLNRKKYVKIFNQLICTWYKFPPNDNSHHILTYLHLQVNVICVTALFVVFIIQVCINFTRDNSVWKIVMVSFTFNLPQMVQLITLSFYYMLVMIVIALMMNIEWHCRLLLKDNLNSKDDCVLVQNRSMLTLKQMKLIYVKAFEIKTDINEAFQGPILATALQCFHSMISEAHIIYHGLVVQHSISIHEILNCSIWIIYQILKIYSVAYSGSLLKLKVDIPHISIYITISVDVNDQRALKIGQILHNIPTEKRDSRWLMEIQHFSTLMCYQDIELNVYGYFPLNATLVYNTLASATMYIIILVQFDKRE